MDDELSRRDALLKAAAFGAFAVFGASACSKHPAPLSCADTSGISPADAMVRTSLGYVDYSVEPGKTCSNCQQFQPQTTPNVCGTCKVVKGPINPSGNCKAYLAKPA